MSLCEAGEGLLQTHVTWSDIELDMQDALGTVATFGPNKKVTNIGEGNGFASRICLIEPDWQNGTADLPEKFVVKIISQLTLVEVSSKMENPLPIDLDAFRSMSEKMRQIHNVEVKIYELIEKHGRGNIPHTKIYKSRLFDAENTLKGYLIMEFYDDLALVHAIDCVESEALDKVLQALAAFERITFELTDEERKSLPTGLLAEICPKVFPKKSLEVSFTQLAKFFGNEMVGEMQKVREYLPKVMEVKNLEKLDNLCGILGMTPVMVHGDLWSTNLLWSKKDDKHQIRAIIDYQAAHIGCVAYDLTRLFCSLLGAKNRRDNTEALLEKFYGYVKEEMKDNIPYTLEQLREAYHLFFPIGSFFVFRGIPALLGYITEHRKNEERDNTMEVVLEKAKGLINDFIEEYERKEKVQNI